MDALLELGNFHSKLQSDRDNVFNFMDLKVEALPRDASVEVEAVAMVGTVSTASSFANGTLNACCHCHQAAEMSSFFFNFIVIVTM